MLSLSANGVSLCVSPWQDPELAKGYGIQSDLLSLDVRSSAGRSKRSPIFRAVWPRKKAGSPPHVIDATAGLGEDTWLLAAAGCQVISIERDPVVYELFKDGLARAATQHPEIAQRITIIQGESFEVLTDLLKNYPQDSESKLSGGIDVVMLDPMFPGGSGAVPGGHSGGNSGGRRKAKERKAMRVIRQWFESQTLELGSAESVRDLALDRGIPRVVVKRPRKSLPLDGPNPHHCHEGQAIRFDVYMSS